MKSPRETYIREQTSECFMMMWNFYQTTASDTSLKKDHKTIMCRGSVMVYNVPHINHHG